MSTGPKIFGVTSYLASWMRFKMRSRWHCQMTETSAWRNTSRGASFSPFQLEKPRSYKPPTFFTLKASGLIVLVRFLYSIAIYNKICFFNSVHLTPSCFLFTDNRAKENLDNCMVGPIGAIIIFIRPSYQFVYGDRCRQPSYRGRVLPFLL